MAERRDARARGLAGRGLVRPGPGHDGPDREQPDLRSRDRDRGRRQSRVRPAGGTGRPASPPARRVIAGAGHTLAVVKAVFGVYVVALLLLVGSPAFASAPNGTDRHANAVLAQASPSPSP